jgi:acetyl-CoA carboxylase carboxyl transferase subunit beta
VSDEGLRWFEKKKDFVVRLRPAGQLEEDDGSPPDWTKCPSCGEAVFNETLADNLNVCTNCGHHLRIDSIARVEAWCDAGSMVLHDQDLVSVDPLEFVDSKPYIKRIELARKKVSRNSAFLGYSAKIQGVDVEIGTFDFRFMGGSMGSVVGEAITRLYERATERGVPAIVISSSGGARMQEGVLSLMQMAKTCSALARLRDEAGMPYISVLTHPTTGGVAASFAMLGDVIFAEPEALIGFAGPRVIKQTIGEDLPEGFQTSEYLVEHGMIDVLVSRLEMRDMLGRFLRQFLGLPARVVDVEQTLIETSELQVAR